MKRLLVMLMLLVSCGKRQLPKHCLSRFQKMQECYQQYNNTHNPWYVEQMCGTKYPVEGCYKEGK